MSLPPDAPQTRRDDPVPRRATEPPSDHLALHRTASGQPEVAGTRRDDGAAPAAGGTRRDAPRADDAPLPFGADPLAGLGVPDLTFVRTLDAQGNEADVHVVAGPDGAEQVLKVYRRDVAPDAGIYDAMERIDSPRLVTVRGTGRTRDDRAYELQEYLSGGDLRGRLRRREIGAGDVVALVTQIGAGLAALHAERIVHRDLKPENVLLRDPIGLDLVLTDFGLSRLLDQSQVFSTAARTILYTAPETFAGHISAARDWWSLGMIVREVATGQRPFDPAWSEQVIMHHLSSRPIDLSGVDDPRTALLCRGLLVRDPATRWGATQVREWLDGGTPVVPRDDGPTDDVRVPRFRVGGRNMTGPLELVAALEEDWATHAAELFGVHRGERWWALKQWLGRFDDTDHYEGKDRQVLCDELDSTRLHRDLKMLRLLTFLHPQRPPTYRGRSLHPADLPALAAEARDARGTGDAEKIVADLWSQQLLREIGTVAAAGGGAVDARWRERERQLRTARAEAARLAGGPPPDASERADRILTLQAALGTAGSVRDGLERAVAQSPGRIDWYARLLDWSRDDEVRELAVLPYAGSAAAEADRLGREAEARRHRRAELERRWVESERDRLEGQGSAVGWALLGGLGLAAVYFVVSLLARSDAMLLMFGAALAVQVVAEALFAARLGRDYHPHYALTRGLSEGARELGWWLRGRQGVGCLVIIGLLFVLPALVALGPPWAVPLLACVAHLGWIATRNNDWQTAHSAAAREALEERA